MENHNSVLAAVWCDCGPSYVVAIVARPDSLGKTDAYQSSERGPVNPYIPIRSVCRSSLIVAAIVFLSLALVLTIILIKPLLAAPKLIPSEEAADFAGYLGTVCGHVTGFRQDPNDGIGLLFIGAPDDPSFTTLISTPNRRADNNYEGRKVCVSGRVANEWGGSQGVPSIRVTDESQLTIE